MAKFSTLYGEYRYVNRLEWFEDDRNIPLVYYDMGERLGLSDTNQKKKYDKLQDYLGTSLGKLAWHMFCKVSYDYPLRDDHDSMGAINVIKAVNSTPNPIFNNDRIREVLAEGEVLGKPFIDDKMAPLFGRLFNLHHCKSLGRLNLFKLKSLTTQRHKCPACGCVFGSHGHVYKKPSVSVDHIRWRYEDKLEGAGSSLRQETKV